jgi:hypothetical protein
MSAVLLLVDSVETLYDSSGGISFFTHANFEKQVATEVSAPLLPFFISDHPVFHLVGFVPYENEVMRRRLGVPATIAETRTKLEQQCSATTSRSH